MSITNINEVSESKFQMWRACFAVAFLDGKVTNEEREWIIEKIMKLPFSDLQKEVLFQDFSKRIHVDECLTGITNKVDQAFLIHLMRVVSQLDGVFSEEERCSYTQLQEKVLKKFDLKEMECAPKSVEFIPL